MLLGQVVGSVLLERRPVPGTGGDIPSVHEVVRDARFGKVVHLAFLCDGVFELCFSSVKKKKDS